MKRSGVTWLITHPEVEIDPAREVTDWSLSPKGRARMTRMLDAPFIGNIEAIWSSTERKAIEAAQILSAHLSIPPKTLAALGENDRSSTGYLPAPEFEAMANRFFAHPQESADGWERAIDAQSRIIAAIEDIASQIPDQSGLAIIGHGGVGALLLCHLTATPISRKADQPGRGGGNYFTFAAGKLLQSWTPIDA
jgi:broad specificity phosphatase PhoE